MSNFNSYSSIEQFCDYMRSFGLQPPTNIEPNRWYRFPGVDKKSGNQAGWCMLFPDYLGGVFGDYSSSLSETWENSNKIFSKEEQNLLKKNFREAQAKMKAELEDRYHHGRKVANQIWDTSSPALDEHPYLVRKNINSCGLRIYLGERNIAGMDCNGSLIIPVMQNNAIWSLQFINNMGEKRFLPGAKKSGGYFLIGDVEQNLPICIAEGYATAVSIHLATRYPVIMVFDSGNMEEVAASLRNKFPNFLFLICADDDHTRENNPGLTSARVSAKLIDAKLAIPNFGRSRDNHHTDFNDMANLLGFVAVKESIDNAMILDNESELKSNLEKNEAKQDKYSRNPNNPSQKNKINATSTECEVIEVIEPWPDKIDPNALLNEIEEVIKRCIISNTETVIAATLWTTMTWFMDSIQVAPLAVITAPEKRCGKSQLLFLLAKMVKNPLPASNITPAALFRAIDEWNPTLLIDEADAFMKDNEELRGILNCGHTRDSAFIVRAIAIGKDHYPRRFNVWGAKALAGIGYLSETIMDRAITLELRRKLPHEKVERLRHIAHNLFTDLKSKLSRFAIDYADTISSARPHLPDILNDRAQDNWEPLFAIADAVGSKWPEQARKAAISLSTQDSSIASIGTELLLNIQDIFEQRKIERCSTTDLIQALCSDDEQPWATYHRGQPITPRQLANLLKGYGIKSKGIRIGNATPKGFEKHQFAEAFERYLNLINPVICATVQQANSGNNYNVAHSINVAATLELSATRSPATDLSCCGVANVADDIVEVVL